MIPARQAEPPLTVLSSASGKEPVARMAEWLEAHPGGTIGRPEPAQLGMRAMADGVIIATAYGDLEVLMDNVDAAEAAGGCPRHPRTVPDTSGGAS